MSSDSEQDGVASRIARKKQVDECLSAIKKFEREGPFTTKSLLALSVQVYAALFIEEAVRKLFRNALVCNFGKFSVDSLVEIYSLAQEDRIIAIALGLTSFTDLLVPVRYLTKDSLPVYAIHVSEDNLQNIFRKKKNMQTAQQRTRMLLAIQQNTHERRQRKGKED